MHPEKLYVVVRADLSPGDLVCQAVHAATAWCMRFPGLATRWFDRSNYLVVLAVPNERDLLDWADVVHVGCRDGFRGVMVTEPDLPPSDYCAEGYGQHTAFAVEHAAGRLLSSLPLACKEVSMV